MHTEHFEPQSSAECITGTAAAISFEEVQQTEKTMRRLKPGNPVRKLARDVMNRRPVENPQPLIDALADPSRSGAERQIAAWTLGWTPLSEAQRQAALDVLRDALEGEQASPPIHFARIGGRILTASMALTLGYMTWLDQQTHTEYPYGSYFHWSNFSYDTWLRVEAFSVLKQTLMLTAILSVVSMVPLSLMLDRKQTNKMRAAAAVALGRMESVASLGALTTALFDRSVAVRRAAVPALKAVLPRLAAEHYGQVGVQVIPNLCRALGHGNEELVLHILNALEKVGDARAVRPVEQLVTKGRSNPVREMAAHILPVLQERQSKENAPKMLLRAASTTSSAPETLLRPVSTAAVVAMPTNAERLPQTNPLYASSVTTQSASTEPQRLRQSTSDG